MLKRLLVLGILLLFTVPVFAADEPVKKPDVPAGATLIHERAEGITTLAVHVVKEDKGNAEWLIAFLIIVMLALNAIVLVFIRIDLSKLVAAKEGQS